MEHAIFALRQHSNLLKLLTKTCLAFFTSDTIKTAFSMTS